MKIIVRGLLLLLAAASGCATAEATTREIPPERATECAAACRKLGMRLSAMVVIMNSCGCVCEPRSPVSVAPAVEGAGGAAGGAAIGTAAAAAAAQMAAMQQQQTAMAARR